MGSGRVVFAGDITPLHPSYYPSLLRGEEQLLLSNIVDWLAPGSNTPPVALPQTVTVDVPMNITLIGSDADSGDTLKYVITALPGSGDLSEGPTSVNTVGHILTADTVTYTPNTGFIGADIFKFKVTDGKVLSNEATITVHVVECAFPAGMVKPKWNLVGWVCDAPGVPSQIAAHLGVVSTTAGLVRILEWDAASQSFTKSYSSARAFNTLNALTKWNGYWLYYQAP